MKKKNFFRGLTMSLALAALGITATTFTSCEKESFSVKPSDIDVNVTATLQFDYNQLKGYLDTWGIASEATLQGAINSQLTQAQVQGIVEAWCDDKYVSMQQVLDIIGTNSGNASDTNMQEVLDNLENLKTLAEQWNPSKQQLETMLADWSSVKSASDDLVTFLNNYAALSDATVSISITVYNWANGELLAYKTQTVKAGTDGKIAEGTKVEVECPYVDGYVSSNSIEVEVPALGKGQAVNIPLTFYVNSIEDVDLGVSNDDLTPDENATEESVTEAGTTVTATMDPSAVSAEPQYNVEVAIETEAGQTVENLDEVYAQIDAMPITRAMTDTDIRNYLKACVKTLSPGIKKESATHVINVINPGYIVNVKVTPQYVTEYKTLSKTVDGNVYEISGILIKRVASNEIVEDQVLVDESLVPSEPVDPDHTGNTDHTGHAGSSHGNSENAGGGTAGK